MKPSFNPKVLPRGYRRDSHMGRVRDSNIYVGVVKRNDDGQRMGRLAVWIPEIGGDPNNPQNWFIVSYASPFAGVTNPNALVEDATNLDGTQQSYGFWMNPPDLENQVLVCFANGDTALGFWFACLYQQNMNHMVPGIATGTPTEDGNYCSSQPPVAEYNKWSKENPDKPKRAAYTPLANGLSEQGLFSDPERGPADSSARREAPSKVYGWLTPRGNQVYVDDNPANEFIRMRTRSGAQVLVNETTGFVYINSKNGNSWVEISDKGVDIYSKGAVSLRSEGSLNLHADGSLNIEADGNLNLRAGGNLTLQSAHHSHFAGNGDLVLDFGGTASTKAGGNILLAATGAVRSGAGGDITASSGGSNIRSASVIFDNASTAAPPANAPSAKVEQPRDLPEVNGSAPCYQQSTRKTITRRMPTHEPFVNHPKAGGSGDQSNNPDLKKSDEYASAADANSVANSSTVPNDDNTSFTDDDVSWLTVCLLTEAGGLGDDMLAAVGQVVMNRSSVGFAGNVRNDAWSGIKKYVLAYAAFSFFWSSNGRSLDVGGGKPARSGSPPRLTIPPALFAAGEKKGIDKIKSSQGSTEWNHCKQIATQLLAGTYNASTAVAPIKANKRCTMYVNASTASPVWAVPSKFVTQVGHPRLSHSFYLQ
jgi:hypothetical protein